MYDTGYLSEPVTADFLTSSYRIVGKVKVTHTGLLGILTARDSSVVEVHEAQLARLDIPSKLADSFELARLVKEKIVAVCMNDRDELGVIAQAGLSAASIYPIHLVTADYEIDGSLEWTGRFDIPAILGQGTGDFIPLYNAVISAILLPGISIQSPAILLNRRWIDLIALDTGAMPRL